MAETEAERRYLNKKVRLVNLMIYELTQTGEKIDDAFNEAVKVNKSVASLGFNLRVCSDPNFLRIELLIEKSENICIKWWNRLRYLGESWFNNVDHFDDLIIPFDRVLLPKKKSRKGSVRKFAGQTKMAGLELLKDQSKIVMDKIDILIAKILSIRKEVKEMYLPNVDL